MGQSIDIENLLILIVEDDDMNYTYLNQIFKIVECELIRAKTGYEGLSLFKQHKNIDLVLMDIKLPDIDGYEVTKEIRRINPQVPIIAQTAGRSSSEIEEAKKAGCTDVIIKPFKMEELLIKIKKSLST
jgi:CheY-like chemotaxis protein